jgi:glycerol kinase
MSARYIAAIDQGTTSSRCIIFSADGAIAALAQKEHRQIFPQPGWVEHDAAEIWENVQTVMRDALGKLSLAPRGLAAIGITNQRETTLLWDAKTGAPLANAIVWQDTRTDALIRDIAGGAAGQDRFRAQCGLPLATYFSGPKIRWLIDNLPGARARAARGEILFGTMETWLIWKLTGRHVTDVTNASRTMLMNLATLDWDRDLLAAFDVPRAMLPEIRSSSERYGEFEGAPVAGALGDQQAALFGQACFEPGEGKCTYGTGAFFLLNTGGAPVQSKNGLLTTLAYKIGEQAPVYALEGSVAMAGSLVQWFRDKLGLVQHASEIEPLARSVEDTGGAYIVPAFSGLFAPYWRSDARGVIAGLTSYVGKAHLARAVLEAVAWQIRETVDAMEADSGVALKTLKVDGGMTANALLMQIQADVLDAPVVRPAVTETTCLGAAYAAGLAVGFWRDLDALRANWRQDKEWKPAMSAETRDRAYATWKKAVSRTLDWLE